MIFNPELLDDEQNWAYLRATQTQPEYDSADEENEQMQQLKYGQTSGLGIKAQLSKKEKRITMKV